MLSNEIIFRELKKGTEYGCRMLVRKFYEPEKKAISAYFGIQYCDTGPIVNQAMEKIINKIDSIEFKSEAEFAAYVKRAVFNTSYDYLRKKQSEKGFLLIENMRFDPLSNDSSLANVGDDNDEEKIEGDFENFEKMNINASEIAVDEEEEIDFEIANSKAEFEFLVDTDTIELNEKNKFIDDLFNSFSPDDGCYLRLYLNNVKHEEIAKIKGSNPEATRQYINRLLKSFLELASKKLNKNYNELYENFKKQNKRTSTK